MGSPAPDDGPRLRAPWLRRAAAWALERLYDAAAHAGVQVLLLLLWVLLLLLTYEAVVAPLWARPLGWPLQQLSRQPEVTRLLADPTAALAWAVLGLCGLPNVLSLSVSVLIRQRRARVRYELIVDDLPDAWDGLLHRVRMQWGADAVRAREGLTQVLQYAGFYGFIASASLCGCAILLGPAVELSQGEAPRALGELVRWPRYAMAVCVAAAACVSFALHLGRILVRAARRDASARLFAWAARAQLLVVVAAVLLVALLMQGGDPSVRTPQGFMMVGAAVALFGERVLQALADRAARVLGLPPMRVQGVPDLQQIEGMSEDDVSRLSEEGIDSVHALALASTARLYFSTTYSMRRIVSWQDQALLQVLCGPRAQQFRDQFLRGAMAAQQLAEQVVESYGGAEHLEDLCKRLGFASLGEAQLGLRPLAEDETVRTLRLYARVGVRRVDDGR